MRKFLLSRTFRAYALAVLSVLVAVNLRKVASPDQRPGMLLLAAVTITTWYGGLRPGILAMMIGVCAEAWVLPPDGSFAIKDRADVERLINFVIMATLITAAYTSRRKAEQKVVLTEQRVNVALAAARIGCWEVDMRSGTFWSSANLPDIFGYPPQEFARTYEGFFAYIHPEDRDFVRLATVSRGSEATYYEIVHRIVDGAGAMRWVCTRGRIFLDGSDKVERMVGAVYLLDAPPGEKSVASMQTGEPGRVLVATAATQD